MLLSLKHRFAHNTKIIQECSKHLGYVMLISFPAFYLFNSYVVSPKPYENLSLRLIIAFMGLFLILKNKLVYSLYSNSAFILNMILGFAFPFFFSFMYFKNNGSSIWQLNELVALIILAFFTDWLTFLIIFTISIFFAATFYIVSTVNPILPEHILAVFGSYSAPVIYFVLQDQTKRMHARQLKTALALSATITHEMQTPLGALHSVSNNLKLIICKYLNKPTPLTEKDANYLLTLSSNLNALINRRNQTIDLMLSNLKDDITLFPLEHLSMQQCLIAILEQYPFIASEKKLIELNINEDFNFKSNVDLLQHVIFNLLKNSFYFIQETGKGNIYIELLKGEKGNTLLFKNTAKGIPLDEIPNLFENISSNQQQSRGVSLAFCRQVMKALDGSITCESVEGEHTTFLLHFPKIDDI